jgi:hypothetical protein
MVVGFGVICAVVVLVGLFIAFRHLPVRGCAYKLLWFLFGVVVMWVALLFGFHVLRL